MNKISLSSNLNINTEQYSINNNVINIKKSGYYSIDYQDNKNNLTYIFGDNQEIYILETSINKELSNEITYNINENSNVYISKFYKNNKTKEIVNINLNKHNASINYNLSIITNNNDYYKIKVNHLHKQTISNIKNKLLAQNNSKLTIDIDSIVKKDMINCTLNQESRAIIFGKEKVKINPNMYIDCNDINAKHSAVIGKFKDEELFYLMTRGITKEDSIKLLSENFLFNNLKFKKEEITNLINNNWR